MVSSTTVQKLSEAQAEISWPLNLLFLLVVSA